MGIEFVIKNPNQVPTYIQQLSVRVIAAMRDGMLEAMKGLADTAVQKMGDAGIKSRTGQTAQNILQSPRAYFTNQGESLKGTVSSWVGAKPMGTWLGEGTNVPAVIADKLMVFTAPDGTLVFTKSHKAFQVPGRPFLNPALEESKGRIVETIKANIAKVMSA